MMHTTVFEKLVVSQHVKKFDKETRKFIIALTIPCLETAGELSQYIFLLSMYALGSKSFRPDQLFKVTEIKKLCYFST